MNHSRPGQLISVLTPCLNAVTYLPRAIESVRSQQYGNWEHIVVDGGSTDGTKQFLEGSQHIRWISERDHGQSNAMNKAFALAQGDIIVYLNADDELAPGALGLVADHFADHPEAAMVVGDLRQELGAEVHVHRPSLEYSDILAYWKFLFPLNPACYYYRRKVQKMVGPFPDEESLTMDYWFLLRALERFRTDRLPIVLGTYHYHGANKARDINEARVHLDRTLRRFLAQRVSLGFVLRHRRFLLEYGRHRWSHGHAPSPVR